MISTFCPAHHIRKQVRTSPLALLTSSAYTSAYDPYPVGFVSTSPAVCALAPSGQFALMNASAFSAERDPTATTACATSATLRLSAGSRTRSRTNVPLMPPAPMIPQRRTNGFADIVVSGRGSRGVAERRRVLYISFR